MSEAGSCAVITNTKLLAGSCDGLAGGTKVIDLAALSANEVGKPRARPRSDDLACIFFTSGSTGKPKGVAITHCGLLQSPQQFTNAAHISSEDRLLLGHSPSVAASPRTIYGALLNGGTLCMHPLSKLHPTCFARWLRMQNVTIWYSTPSLLRTIAREFTNTQPLRSIRVVNLGGERVEWNDIDLCRRCFAQGVAVCITFASTESAGSYCHWFVDDKMRSRTLWPPVGRATPHRIVSITDEDGKAVADGDVGEIVVKSRYTSAGRWDGPTRM